jgi:hypothetical protein
MIFEFSGKSRLARFDLPEIFLRVQRWMAEKQFPLK